ncbi:MAG: MBL fold metallo-hydrolase [Myxococcota bacterium]|nr:MBL fold metallo-hydrolase [Myxococcota bacterium]
MWRAIRNGIVGFLVLALAGSGGVLAWAHAGIRREQAPLPSLSAAVRAVQAPGGPVRLAIANTASQTMPRSSVLDAARDPAAGAPYVMSHPSFVLEWADGRILLVDVGMDRAGAASFGRPIELLSGGEPIEPHDAVATQLGDAAGRVDGIVFTHLHEDHVGGVVELCRGRPRPLRVFMTEAQDQRGNHTTRAARRLLTDARRGAQTEADPPCVERVRIASGGAQPVPGFPGTAVVAAGGHTPGSQIVLAAVAGAGGAGRLRVHRRHREPHRRHRARRAQTDAVPMARGSGGRAAPDAAPALPARAARRGRCPLAGVARRAPTRRERRADAALNGAADDACGALSKS